MAPESKVRARGTARQCFKRVERRLESATRRQVPQVLATLSISSVYGTTHEVLARCGEGPGEVIYPYSMFVLGQDSVLVPDNRQSRLTLFVGDSVARIASLPRSAHLGVAGIGSSGESLLVNRYPAVSWTGLEEEWLAGHMTLFDTETGVLDTVASYDLRPGNPPGLPANPIRALGEVTVGTGQFVYTRSDRPEIT